MTNEIKEILSYLQGAKDSGVTTLEIEKLEEHIWKCFGPKFIVAKDSIIPYASNEGLILMPYKAE